MIKAAVLSVLLTSAAQAQTYTFRTTVDGSPPLIESSESGGGSTNTAPTSSAGTDQTVDSAATVTLDGTGSSDPDVGDTLTYAWTQDSGTSVTLSDASVSQPTFTAPTLGSSDPAATLVFSLVVTDSAAAASTADTVSITVNPPASVGTAADCYDPVNVGTVGQVGWTGCEGMLIVDTAMLRGAGSSGAGGDSTYMISGPGGRLYSFAYSGDDVFTGQVTDMSELFSNRNFNGNIGYWDTSSVTNMREMFNMASSFNQPIGTWDTSSVTNMTRMFQDASAFNRDLSDWCVSNFASPPLFFAVRATSWAESQPVWGTCPAP